MIDRSAVSPVAALSQCFCSTTVALCRVLVYTQLTGAEDGTVKVAVAPLPVTVKSTG